MSRKHSGSSPRKGRQVLPSAPGFNGSQPPAPRLSILLAADAPVGVVFRRGPSKMVRVIIWDRTRDKFKPVSWFKGRIDGDRSDISPDGRHLIYFAMGGVAWAIPATGGTWTAISELPSLKAKALWGQGGTTRGGGGVFLSNTTYWLDADGSTFLIRHDSGLRRETYGPHVPHRSPIELHGWIGKRGGYVKELRAGWILRRLAKNEGYELEQPGEGTLKFPNWEWADWDRNRLVWAEGGRIKAARIGAHKVGTIRTLCDLNEMGSRVSKARPPKESPPTR